LTGEVVNGALKKYPRKKVAKDDIVDGLVGAVTATFSGRLRTLPEEPEVDATGLSMEIVYAKALPSNEFDG
jgi:predicted RNase H-like nuclease